MPASVQSEATPHWVILGVCVSILVGASVLRLSDSMLLLGRMPIPRMCVLQQTTGVPCPGCGLSRSLVAAIHGDWATSLAFHRLGLLVLVFLVLQASYRVAWLGLPRLRGPLAKAGRILDRTLVPLLVLLFLNWVPTLMEAVGL